MTPVAVYENNILFRNQYRDIAASCLDSTNLDLDYFVTPYGLFIPIDSMFADALHYVKNPTPEKNGLMKNFTTSFLMVTIEGRLFSVSISGKTQYNFFCVGQHLGPGVKTVYSEFKDFKAKLRPLMHIAESYEEFISLFNKVSDVHGSYFRLSIPEIVTLLKNKGVTETVNDCRFTTLNKDLDI